MAGLCGSLAMGAAAAEPHRATRLGDPATRFAKPLQKPEDLRALFRDETLKADVISILRQAGWEGDVEDLRRAAATAEIVAVKLPTCTRLPFMSTRRNGKALTLIDVLWAGKEPISAYEFEFSSKGRRYRCVTPKPCANFLVVDLGPESAVHLTKTVPREATVCEPFAVRLSVRNTGGTPLTGVRVTDALPACFKTTDDRSEISFDAGTLQPGETRDFAYQVRATAPGPCGSPARVTATQGVSASAQAGTMVRAPVLAVECSAPSEVPLGRPIEVCLTVRNSGDAPEPRVTLALPIPGTVAFASASDGGTPVDGRVVWELPSLGPGESRRVCAVLTARETGATAFAASAVGACAPPIEARCETRLTGIPAILLEVVDVEDPIEVGQPVTYEIRVLNQGSAPGTRVRMVCQIPESQEYVSGNGPTAVRCEGRTVTMEPVDVLEPKAEVTWRVVVKALAGADARFKVELTSDQFPTPIEEYEATLHY
jgi:hypothetical protein